MSTFTFSVRRRDLAWAVALVVLLTAIWIAKSDVADAGGSPPGTGIAVVYVAVSTNYPDSLGVGPGAGGNGAPIIILPTSPPIPTSSSAELVRLDPRTLIIIGGTTAISVSMETALGSLLPNAAISRIGGLNRYETNAMFSEQTFPIEGWASIPPAAFTTNIPRLDLAGAVSLNRFINATGLGEVYAPIQLPHGAEILELKIVAYDGSAGTVFASLVRLDSTLTTAAIAGVATSGTSGLMTVATTTIATGGLEIVDNENGTYFVYVSGVTSDYISIVMVRYRLGVSTG